jgi:hypothetical protein
MLTCGLDARQDCKVPVSLLIVLEGSPEELKTYYWNDDAKLERPRNCNCQHRSHDAGNGSKQRTCTKADTPLDGELRR